MQNYTHFVEVWKDKYGNTHQDDIEQISNYHSNYLQISLNSTKKCQGKTIAVWKIRQKPMLIQKEVANV